MAESCKMAPDSQPSEMHMKTETIEYKDGDVTLRGYLAYDEKKSGKRPASS